MQGRFDHNPVKLVLPEPGFGWPDSSFPQSDLLEHIPDEDEASGRIDFYVY